MIRGEIVWFYAFDVAFEAKLDKIPADLLADSSYRKAGRFRGSPETVSLYAPLVIDLVDRPLSGGGELQSLRRSVKLFAVGALSVTLRMPFALGATDDLLSLRRLEEVPEAGLGNLARDTAREVFERVRAGFVRPHADWQHSESYAVVCIAEADGLADDALAWVAGQRNTLAAVLAGHYSGEALSVQQIDESLRLTYGYSRADVVIVDWDAMLVVDPAREYEEALYVAEAANLQMVELRAHEASLDLAIDKAYEAFSRHRRQVWFLRQSGRLADQLRVQKVDLARMGDEIGNLSKYFGDWYLARIYDGLRSRFHLEEWEEQLERRLKTVDTLFDLIARENYDRKMLTLEAAIVLLFILDLILLVVGL